MQNVPPSTDAPLSTCSNYWLATKHDSCRTWACIQIATLACALPLSFGLLPTGTLHKTVQAYLETKRQERTLEKSQCGAVTGLSSNVPHVYRPSSSEEERARSEKCSTVHREKGIREEVGRTEESFQLQRLTMIHQPSHAQGVQFLIKEFHTLKNKTL